MKRFSDFANEDIQLEGAKVKLDDILNREIEIIAFRVADSKYNKNESGKYATVQFSGENGQHPCVFFTGSDVLINQLEKYRAEIPFIAVIKKINRYYTLTVWQPVIFF